MKLVKTVKIAMMATSIMLVADWFYLRQVQRQPTAVVSGLSSYNEVQLAQYNGDDASLPVYLALDGYVYDISAGRGDFYAPGAPYHDLAGKDSSTLLHMVGAEIIKRKYSVIGVYTP